MTVIQELSKRNHLKVLTLAQKCGITLNSKFRKNLNKLVARGRIMLEDSGHSNEHREYDQNGD